jgi:hypothetical protein
MDEYKMTSFIRRIIGPRTPTQLSEDEIVAFRRPTLFLLAAAFCILVSIFLPYWKMTLLAPQYPGGLSVQTYVNRITGDVDEIDGLNHYIGMRPLEEAAQLERSLSIAILIVLSLLIVAATFIHSPWAAVMALPAMLFPIIFLADMYFWLRNFGLNLDPTAALSSAIDPFVPPILGEGMLAQFRTIAEVQSGFYIALLGSIFILIGLFYQRRAYKPLAERSADTPERLSA